MSNIDDLHELTDLDNDEINFLYKVLLKEDNDDELYNKLYIPLNGALFSQLQCIDELFPDEVEKTNMIKLINPSLILEWRSSSFRLNDDSMRLYLKKNFDHCDYRMGYITNVTLTCFVLQYLMEF